MLTPKKVGYTVLLAAAGVALTLSQGGWKNQEAKAAKLQGSWMITVPGTPVRAGFNLSPYDSSGRQASLCGDYHAPMPPVLYGLPPEYIPEELPPGFTGEMKMVGHNEAVGILIWWAMRDTVEGEPAYPFKQVVHIGVSTTTLSFASPDKAVITMALRFFDPSADGDGDGLPDAGVEPVFSTEPVAGVASRITASALLPPE